GDLRVYPGPHRPAEIDLLVQVVLFDVGQQVGRPAPARPDVVVGGAVGVRVAIDVAGREAVVGVVVVVQGQADLLEVVRTLHACGGLADLLHGRQQQPDEDADDGDDDQKLDQREAPAAG